MTILGEYYEKSRDSWIKYLESKTRCHEDAEDILHNAFYRALRWEKSYSTSKGILDSWMGSIINNAIKDYYKNEKGAEVNYVFEIGEINDLLPIRDVDRYIESLKDGVKKEVLELYLKDERKAVEIYRMTDIPYSTVKTVIRRFREEMKEYL